MAAKHLKIYGQNAYYLALFLIFYFGCFLPAHLKNDQDPGHCFRALLNIDCEMYGVVERALG